MSKSTRAARGKIPTWLWPVLGILVVLGVGGFTVGARMENRDGFCASCHTEPETAYVQRTTQEPAPDLAAFHAGKGVRCIDCHSGDGMSGRIRAEMLGARDALVYLTGRDQQPHHATRPIEDVNCLKCHADVLRQRSFERHFHALLPQWQQFSADAARCVDCHLSHRTDGDPRIAFLIERPTVQVCQACHAVAGE